MMMSLVNLSESEWGKDEENTAFSPKMGQVDGTSSGSVCDVSLYNNTVMVRVLGLILLTLSGHSSSSHFSSPHFLLL